MNIELCAKQNNTFPAFQPALLAGCSTVFTLTCAEPDKVTEGPFSQTCDQQLLLEKSFRRGQLSTTIIYYHRGRRRQREEAFGWVEEKKVFVCVGVCGCVCYCE